MTSPRENGLKRNMAGKAVAEMQLAAVVVDNGDDEVQLRIGPVSSGAFQEAPPSASGVAIMPVPSLRSA